MRFLDDGDVRKFLKEIPESAIFSVIIEKADGTLRRMVCRRGVKKHLKGGATTYDKNPDNVGVYDTEVGQYRCFNATRVISIRGGGRELRVVDGVGESEPIYDGRGELVKKR